MSAPVQPPPLSDADWNALEALVEEFESAWSSDSRPKLADFVRRAGESWRAAALRELIHADAEFRARSGEPANDECYGELLRDFPDAESVVASAVAHWKEHTAPKPEPVKIGRYEVRARAGRGATASVYRAWDPVLEREVAIKVPLAALFAVPESRARLLREARSVAQLRHPAIVAVHETGEDADGTPWIVSDFISGPTLDQVIRDSPPQRETAVRWVLRLAEALDYAHQCGVVHRDVKPANVLLDAAGQPVLTDFGLALFADTAAATLTRQGDVLGTPAYMSPEQARGESHAVDARTDVYSLGVMLYELVCRRRPFEGASTTVIHQLLHDDPPPPRRVDRSIPADLETICLTAMAREPQRRYAGMARLAGDLRRFLNNEPIAARRTGMAGRAWLWARRRPALAGTIAAALAAVVATAAFAYVRVTQERNAARESLYHSLIREARAERLTRRDGSRDRVFTALREAAASGAASVNHEELRNEAAAVLGDFAMQSPREVLLPPGVFFVSVSASANSRIIAAGATDGSIRMFDAGTGTERALHRVHAHGVFALAFSRDGQWLASADDHGGVRIWTAQPDGAWTVTRELQTSASADPGVVGAISLGFPAGDLLMACPKGARALSLWRLADGSPITPPDSGKEIFRAAVSPDGTQAAALCYDTAVVHWQTGETWKQTARRETGFSTALDLLFTPVENQLICLQQRAAALFKQGSLTTGAEWQTDRLFSAAASFDGRWIALPGHNSNLVRLRECRTGRELSALQQPGDPHSACFTPDGRMLVTQSASAMRFWQLHPPEKPHTFNHDGPVTDILWLSSTLVASTGSDGTLRIHDLKSGTCTVKQQFHGRAGALTLSQDGELLLLGDRRTVYALPVQGIANSTPPLFAVKHSQDAINSIALSRDRSRLYAAGSQKVEAWRLVTSSLAVPMSAVSDDRGGSLQLTSDDRSLWWVDKGGTILCVDLRSGESPASHGNTALFSGGLVFDAGGSEFYALSDGEIVRRSSANGSAAVKTGIIAGNAAGFALSPGGRYCLVGGVRPGLFDVATRRRLAQFPASEAPPEALAFNADGHLLALGHGDGRIEVWDIAVLLRELESLPD